MHESHFICKQRFVPCFLPERFAEESEHMSCRGVRRVTVATFALPSVAMFIMVGWNVYLDPFPARHRSQHAV
jgi:hypothetical protein